MILKPSCRGTPVALGRHLTNEQDNEIVEQHEVRGFMSDDVMGAMEEMQGISKGVRSRQPLFSVSLSPPEHEEVAQQVFERAIEDIEERNGLSGQPRIVVFHEKEGRRHAHAVWSRIESEHMRVAPLPFYKKRLQEISKSVYLKQGWDLPAGHIDRAKRDPRNFDLAMYQQMKREGRDPKQVKMLAQEAWAISDSNEAFANALEERGLFLAKGDRRGHVAMTWQGEVMSLPRLLGKKSKEVRDRLGAGEELRGVESTREHIAKSFGPALFKLVGQSEAQQSKEMQPLDRERQEMGAGHKAERLRMDTGQQARIEAENRQRAERMRKGLAGLMDRVTGRQKRMQKENEREAYTALIRDRTQRDDMVAAQLRERRTLQARIRSVRQAHEDRVQEIHRDLSKQREAIQQPSARLDWLQANTASARREHPAATVERTEVPLSKRENRLQWLQNQQARRAGPDRDMAADRDPDLGMEPE